jgi:hypothetical protein
MERVGLLRRAIMREGVTPWASQPRLMRGEASFQLARLRAPLGQRHWRPALRPIKMPNLGWPEVGVVAYPRRGRP